MNGQCSCGEIHYEMNDTPLFVHACHCANCQRQSGTAHALNAMIEAKCIQLKSGNPEGIDVETGSGMTQTIYRCPTCKIGLWSTYERLGSAFYFVRVGTLEAPGDFPPDINIFSKSKQPWVTLREGIPSVPEFYEPSMYWPDDKLQRMAAALG